MTGGIATFSFGSAYEPAAHSVAINNSHRLNMQIELSTFAADVRKGVGLSNQGKRAGTSIDCGGSVSLSGPYERLKAAVIDLEDVCGSCRMRKVGFAL